MFVSNSASKSHILPSLSRFIQILHHWMLLKLHLLFLVSSCCCCRSLSLSVCMMNGIRNFNHVAKVLRVVDTKRGKYEKFSRFIIAQEAGKLFMNIAKENFDVVCIMRCRRKSLSE
jgi:hypothetical protein